MKKIAILSDIHGNMPALEKVTEDLKTRQVDCVFNLGDHVSGPLWPGETIQYLMKQDWIQIRGNHDDHLANQDPMDHGLSDRYAYQKLNKTELEWLKALPFSLEIQDEFLLFHATPGSATTYLLETVEHGRVRLATQEEISERLGKVQSRVILCGHTHIQRVIELPDNKLLINPGSVGLPAYSDVSPEYHVVENGSPHARYAIMEKVNRHWRIETIAIEYDYKLASDQAHKNNRYDWEVSIRTGFFKQT